MSLSAGSRLGPYEIVSPLGAGAMGEVYRARDKKLDRDVAIKVLPESVAADPDTLARFEREAKAVAALSHPNILSIFDFGTHEGTAYVVMELLEGKTLRERLDEGPIPQKLAVDYALQIVKGLSAAHEKGIVHRDLKPRNLFVMKDGHVKILDFGLAKRIEAIASGEETSAPTAAQHTMPGTVMGTMGYMSPEQVRGLPVDHRSDIFAFGAILYELLSGERAFKRDTASDTIAAILIQEPSELSESGRSIPPALERIVKHCLEKDRDNRFHSARDIAFALGEASSGSAAALATLAAQPPRSRAFRPLLWAAGVAALAALAAAVLWLRPGARTIDSVAVLPFVNAGGDPNAEYLSDGITESLIDSVSQIPGIKVISRASAFHYKGKDVGARIVGRELGVRAVLTGQVVQRGDALSIRAELVDARDETHLWGEEYNRRLSDILAVQEEIARDISGKLRQRLTGEEKKRLAKRYTENAEAYALYLKGRYDWNKRTGEDIQKAIGYFRQAIDKDPTYALAYAGLADSYAILFYYAGLPPSETFLMAKAAASKALEIDDTLAQAHATLAFVHENFDWDFSAAGKEYRRAIELDPKYPTAHHWYSLYLSGIGRHEQAIAEAERVYKLDPLSPIISNLRAAAFYSARQYDRAIEAARKTLELDKGFSPAHFSLGCALEQKKMYPEAIAALEEAVRLSGRRIRADADLGHAYAVSGRREEAMRMIEELKARSERGYDPVADIALVYAGLGQNDEAMRWLEKAYQARSAWLIRLAPLKVDPRWDALRSDARFQDLLRRIGFPS
ncbi:MAG TPA: protein kinase [Thermoanaerobaculia bacterium]|nr:protein kinase [Thermoanaerobaculia bacterium]